MQFIPAALAVLVAVAGYLLRARAKRGGKPRGEKIGLVVSVLGLWLLVGSAITLLFGAPVQEEFTIHIIPPRSNLLLFGYQPSETMLVGWGVTAGILILAVVLRIFFIPRMTDVPGPFQNAVELLVETVENYTSEQSVELGRPMFGYIFAIGVTLIGNVTAELMGFRSPSSDLMFTMALALSVFLMANWYGLRKLSLRGRLKNLASPAAMLLPIRLVTDLVNPFSMACRLFGNTISGMIVINLIYSALGHFATGIPSVVGLYFNVFSALIQTLIFVTLGLAMIRDATLDPNAPV